MWQSKTYLNIYLLLKGSECMAVPIIQSKHARVSREGGGLMKKYKF